jgi:hypothetical protein
MGGRRPEWAGGQIFDRDNSGKQLSGSVGQFRGRGELESNRLMEDSHMKVNLLQFLQGSGQAKGSWLLVMLRKTGAKSGQYLHF